MSSNSVMKLDDDVLWHIFLVNSHPIPYPVDGDTRHLLGIEHSPPGSLPEPALITTRRTSQVCKQWRQVLLSPHGHLIWANTLDLRYLNQQGDQWREEVLRRTGDVPLTVIGHVAERPVYPSSNWPRNHFAVPFFFELLNVHWERIRVLVILSDGVEVDRQLEIALNRPAPLLEHCVVELHGTGIGQGTIVPFTNHAPSLSSFSIQDHKFNLSALSWACTLRYLNLRWPHVHVVTSDILQHLERMPLLETVFLDFGLAWDQKPEITTPIPHIGLPRLRYLSLYSPRAPDLLPYITLSPLCKIAILRGRYDDRAHVYSRYVQAHFHEWNVTDISYRLELVSEPEPEPEGEYHTFYDIILKDKDKDDDSQLAQFEYHAGSRKMRMALAMAAALSSCELDRVKTFHLNLFIFDAFITNVNDPDSDALYDLLGELSSLETVHVERKALKLLREADSRSEYFMFPRLSTVVADDWDVSLKEYLSSRKKGGPVSHVVFKEGSRVGVGDTSVLQEAASLGVSVGWKIIGEKDVPEFPLAPNSVEVPSPK